MPSGKQTVLFGSMQISRLRPEYHARVDEFVPTLVHYNISMKE